MDVAFTYVEAAELALVRSGAAAKRVLAFLVRTIHPKARLSLDPDIALQDHFYLVGPESNPAGLSPDNDTTADMFNKIVFHGNADVAVGTVSLPPCVPSCSYMYASAAATSRSLGPSANTFPIPL